MKQIGEGFSCRVYETHDGLIIRAAKYHNPALKIEFDALRQLAGTLAVPVPRPAWYTSASDEYPQGAVAFEKLPGKLLQPGPDALHLAPELATFLDALHTTPPPDGVPVTDTRYLMWKLHDATMPYLKGRVAKDVMATMCDWWATVFADEQLTEYTPALCHGDLWYENVLVQDNTITGIIDWENITIGDPMMDFAPQYYLGDDFAQTVIDAYQGEISLHRIQHWRQIREWFGMRTALHHDPNEFDDALAKILSTI